MFAKARRSVARVGIGFALFLGLLGLFMSFVPGAAAEWFGVAAGSASLGLLSSSWRMRLFAVGLVVALTWFAWAGYQHGLRHQEWLRLREPISRKPRLAIEGLRCDTEPSC